MFTYQDALTRGAATWVAELLKGCPEIGCPEVEPLAVFLVLACTSMLQAAFMDYVVDRETIRAHMSAMVRGYLREAGAPRTDRRSHAAVKRTAG